MCLYKSERQMEIIKGPDNLRRKTLITDIDLDSDLGCKYRLCHYRKIKTAS